MLKVFLIVNLICFSCLARSAEKEAVNKTVEAFFIYNKIDKMVNDKIIFYRERIPKEYEPIVKLTNSMLNIVIQQKVVFKYEF